MDLVLQMLNKCFSRRVKFKCCTVTKDAMTILYTLSKRTGMQNIGSSGRSRFPNHRNNTINEYQKLQSVDYTGLTPNLCYCCWTRSTIRAFYDLLVSIQYKRIALNVKLHFSAPAKNIIFLVTFSRSAYEYTYCFSVPETQVYEQLQLHSSLLPTNDVFLVGGGECVGKQK
jgi:hypothetical protein